MIIGLASRAEITFFDEPYLGLDAVARQIFYDRLLEDYTEHPRTVILSSHLIDEVSNLIEKVLVIDRGRIIMDEDTDAVRDRAANIVGDAAAVDAFVAGREVIHRESLGRVTSVTVLGALTAADRERLAAAGLDVAPVSLQQLIVRTDPARRARYPTERRLDRRSAAMNRTLNVVRMQLINKQTYIWIPLIILGGAFVLALAIYAILAGSACRPVLRRRRAGAALVLRRRRHPGAHAHVPVLAGDERHAARVLPRHAAHRGADLRDPRGDRRRRRPHRARDRRLGHQRLVLRAAVDLGGRAGRRLPVQLRRSRCCSS